MKKLILLFFSVISICSLNFTNKMNKEVNDFILLNRNIETYYKKDVNIIYSKLKDDELFFFENIEDRLIKYTLIKNYNVFLNINYNLSYQGNFYI